MKKKMIKATLLTLLLVAIGPMAVFAEDVNETDSVGNRFAAGNEASISSEAALDAFCAGQDCEISECSVLKNAFIAGNQVEVNECAIGADLFAAGNYVEIEDSIIEANLYSAGNVVTINEETNAIGMFVAGNDVTVNGNANGASISGDTVCFDGTVDGDIEISAPNVIIGENAVVNGELTVKSEKEPDIPDSAAIGSYYFEQTSFSNNEVVKPIGLFARFVKKCTSTFYWIIAMAVAGLLMCLMFGNSLDDAYKTFIAKPGEIILYGIISWLVIPIAVVVIALTFIGLPIAAILLTVYISLLCVGLAFAGASFGRMAFPKLHPVLASVIGIAILECVRAIPVIGGIVGVAADMYILGYVARTVVTGTRGNINSKKKTVVAEALSEPPVIEEKE